MQSPIDGLHHNISACITRTLPEEAATFVFQAKESRFKPIFTNNQGTKYRINSKTHNIELPRAALEYHWCQNYALYFLYSLCDDLRLKDTKVYHVNEDKFFQNALRLLNDAHAQLREQKKIDWTLKQAYLRGIQIEILTNRMFLKGLEFAIFPKYLKFLKEEFGINSSTLDREVIRKAYATKQLLKPDERNFTFRGIAWITAMLSESTQNILCCHTNETDVANHFAQILTETTIYFHDENSAIYMFLWIIFCAHFENKIQLHFDDDLTWMMRLSNELIKYEPSPMAIMTKDYLSTKTTQALR